MHPSRQQLKMPPPSLICCLLFTVQSPKKGSNWINVQFSIDSFLDWEGYYWVYACSLKSYGHFRPPYLQILLNFTYLEMSIVSSADYVVQVFSLRCWWRLLCSLISFWRMLCFWVPVHWVYSKYWTYWWLNMLDCNWPFA